MIKKKMTFTQASILYADVASESMGKIDYTYPGKLDAAGLKMMFNIEYKEQNLVAVEAKDVKTETRIYQMDEMEFIKYAVDVTPHSCPDGMEDED